MNQQYEKVIKYAMQMEMDGHNFFKEKSKMFENPTTADLFRSLAEIELEHYHFLDSELKRFRDDGSEYKVDTSFFKKEGTHNIFEERGDQASLDTTLIESDVPDITILRMAYLIERDFAEFYEEAAEAVEDKELEKLFQQLAQWEYSHEDLFKREYIRLRKEYMNLPWGG